MSSAAIRAGTVLDERYRLERLAYESGMCQVFTAADLQEPGMRVMLRIIRSRFDASRDLDHLWREFFLLYRLKHRNLAKLFNIGLLPEGRGLFVASELLPGPDVLQATEKWSRPQVVRLLVEIAAVLHHLHAQKIICRDLRASGILLPDADASPEDFKVYSYGVTARTAQPKLEEMGESLAYAAPELLEGGFPDEKSDLYAFGILAYQLLARRLPFQQEDPGLLVQQHLQARVDMRPIDRLWGSRLACILQGLLEKDPARRPVSAEEAAAGLVREAGIKVDGTAARAFRQPLVTGRFIARERELSLLQERADRVRETGRGWTVFVTGDTGSGESICLEQLKIWARLKGWRVAEASCQPGDSRFYEPFRQLLLRTESLVQRRATVDSLFAAGPGQQDPLLEDAPRADAGRFRDQISRELVCRLGDRPTLVLMHHFNLADEATTAVLDYLGSDLLSHPIFMCISLRPPETEHSPVALLMDNCLRQMRAERLSMDPLPLESVRDLVERATGSRDLARRLGTWVHRASGGSPFLAEEILHHLAAESVLVWESGEWMLRDEALQGTSPPSSVLDIIRMRLHFLSPDARRAAEWLALLNREAGSAQLQALIETDGDRLSAALDELVQRHLVERRMRDEADLYAPAHTAMTEMIRAAIPKAQRARMHRRIAEELERQSALEIPPQELAVHFMEAGWTERAVPFALRAAAACKNEYAHEAALRFQEYLLRWRKHLTQAQLAEVAIDAASSCGALGMSRKAVRLLTDVLDEVPDAGTIAHAGIYLQLAKAHQAEGDLKMLAASAQQGIALLSKAEEEEEAGPLKISLLIQLAYAAHMQGRPKTGLKYLTEALLATPDPERSQQAGRIYNLIGVAHWIGSDLQAAVRAGEKAVRILEAAGNAALLAPAKSNLGEYWISLGRLRKGREQLEGALRLGEESRAYIFQCAALSNLSEGLCRAGRLKEADATCRRALNLIGETGNPALFHTTKAISAEIKLLTCDYAEAWRLLTELEKQSTPDLFPYSVGHSSYLAAAIHFQFGRFDSVLKELDRLERIETEEAPLYHRPLGEVLRALILYERRKGSRAIQLLCDLIVRLDGKHWPYHECAARLGLGELLIRSGREDEAARRILQAKRLAYGVESLHLQSHAHMLMGMALTRRLERTRRHPSAEGAVEGDALPAIHELQTGLRLARDAGLLELCWRTERELARLSDLVDDAENAARHARNALEVLAQLDDRVPAQMLSGYQHALGRSHARNAMRRLLERLKQERPEIVAPPASSETEQVRLFLRTSTSIIAIRELDPLLDAVSRQAIADMEIDRALLFLRDEGRDRMSLAKGRAGTAAVTPGTVPPVAWRVVEEAAKTGRPIISADTRRDPRFSSEPEVRDEKVGMIMCFPLRAAGRVLGVLYTDQAIAAEGLGEARVNLFAALANLVAIAIDNALVHQKLVAEKKELEEHLQQVAGSYSEILGVSTPMQAIRDRIATAAASPLDILVFGESGTGKELVARAIHRTGRRAGGRFVAVDCGSLADSISESEFFGYRKGAFTGATEDRTGLLEAASGGVIFFDEIANLPARLQGTLLRALQEREIRRIGETAPRRLDLRVIAATNRDLRIEIEQGRFRQDLYYRLNAMEIRLPPLRSRLEDVPLLLAFFLEKTAQEEDGRRKGISQEASALLARYEYPGNVRELRNIIRSAYYSAAGNVIGIEHLPEEVRSHHVKSRSEAGSPLQADAVFEKIRSGEGTFAEQVKKPFQQHQLEPAAMRRIVECALQQAGGSYRDAFRILHVPGEEYSQTLLFLKRHGCYVDFRSFRKTNRS